jgi:hypothetical protein
VTTPTAARSIPQLREAYVLDEVVLVLSPETVLVASKSLAGAWNTVTLLNGQAHSCSCDGFGFRGTCRHLKAATLAVAPVVPAPVVCAPARPRLFEGRSILAAFSVEEDEHGHAIPSRMPAGSKEQML